MRVLAEESRLALLDTLHRRGPSTLTDLASLLDSQPRQIREHLTALEDVGLVERCETGVENEQATWAAVGKGLFSGSDSVRVGM
jgi:predicted transcriptional regulator